MKTYKTILTLLLITMLFITQVFALPSYTEKFYYAGYGYGGTVTMISPFRSGSDSNPDYGYGITSKYSNPRPLSSTPHGGVDFGCQYNDYVYPMKNGQVVGYNDDTLGPGYAAFGYYVIVRFDMNGDGIYNSYDNVYARYAHLSQILITSGTVTITSKIGRAGNTGYDMPTHLHVDMRDSGTPLNDEVHEYPWYKYFSYNAAWNSGKDLDWLTADVKSYRTFSIYCYGRGGGTTNMAPDEVKLFIRVRDSGSAWTAYTMTSQGSYMYAVTIPTNVFTSGTQVEYFFSGKRTSASPEYQYGFYPAKFKQPDFPPLATKEFARLYAVM